MTNGTHLLILDLASYGSALAIINQFCDGKDIQVFEVSPLGSAGLLVLMINEETTAHFLKNEIISFFKSSILSICLIENCHVNILKVYLSQNKDDVSKNLLVQEFSFVSEAFAAAQALFQKKISLIDFRIVRTFPLNAILVSTSTEANLLVEANSEISSRASRVIQNVEATLKSYFQIVKN